MKYNIKLITALALPAPGEETRDPRRQMSDQRAAPQAWVADVDHAASASQLSTR